MTGLRNENSQENKDLRQPEVLLIHPPIHDFSAFDFYLYPLGLVNLGEALMEQGYGVRLLDALDRFHPSALSPGLKAPTFRKDGCGHFPRAEINRPAQLAGIPRRFHRFGLPEEALRESLAAGERPEVVGITCAMTYWYPGVIEMVRMVRGLWPGIPVALGGVYPSLCPDHAEALCEADLIFQGSRLAPFLQFLAEKTGTPPAAPPASGKSPRGHALPGKGASAAVRTARGCPKKCPYCAASLLGGPFEQRPAEEVLDEITYLVRDRGLAHIAFYDDALLHCGEQGFQPLARGILERGLQKQASFHCPNALHASAIDETTAALMKACGFDTIRLGFETANAELQRKWGNKTTNSDLTGAMEHLIRAGFHGRRIGVYILAGLPDQDWESVEASIRFVHQVGACSKIAEYAPVPGTPLFDRAKALSRLDLEEPMNQNKTLAAFRFPTLTHDNLRSLKDLTRKLNEEVIRGE